MLQSTLIPMSLKEQSQIQIGVYNVAPGLKTIKLFKPFWFVFDYAIQSTG